MIRFANSPSLGEAAKNEQLAEAKERVDRVVRIFMAAGLFRTEEEAREDAIQLLKDKRKLPADYSYPEPSNQTSEYRGTLRSDGGNARPPLPRYAAYGSRWLRGLGWRARMLVTPKSRIGLTKTLRKFAHESTH